MNNQSIDVLGTSYKIKFLSPAEDKNLQTCDGYCDKTSKLIVVTTENTDLGDFLTYQKSCLRHEIIHAFLFESGLSNNWEHKPYGHEETVIDWIALQFPKILKVFMQLNCI